MSVPFLPQFLHLASLACALLLSFRAATDFSSAYQKNASGGIFLVCTVIHVRIHVRIHVLREELIMLYRDGYPFDRVNSAALVFHVLSLASAIILALLARSPEKDMH